jgi:Na+/proline symporter
MMVVDLLPSGLRGLMLASFFAAFMSTLSTYLNLSSAYFVNDFYRPFLRKDADDRHYIAVARLMTVVLSALTAVVTFYVTSIIGVFKFLIAFGSGTGLVYIMRWFWWRVNAWSEISAMITSTAMTVVAYTVLKGLPYYVKLGLIISVSTAVWLLVTMATRPAEREKLEGFLKRARPAGPGWRPVREMATGDPGEESLLGPFLDWIYGCLFLIGLTIGAGKMLLGFYLSGYIWLMLSLVTGWLIKRRTAGWKW